MCYVETVNWDLILNNINDLDSNLQCSCSEYRNGAQSTDNNLCMGPRESWGRPCYPLQNNNCNSDWTKCTTRTTEWCDGSPSQTCRMLCPSPSCDSNQCAMREGSCCGYNCLQKYQNYLLDNNGENCSSCYTECDGCFAEGPRMCQRCKNYKSGSFCVAQCPLGTTEEGVICRESYPGTPSNFNVEVLNSSSVNITWNNPEIPRGIITEYIIYQNDIII